MISLPFCRVFLIKIQMIATILKRTNTEAMDATAGIRALFFFFFFSHGTISQGFGLSSTLVFTGI